MSGRLVAAITVTPVTLHKAVHLRQKLAYHPLGDIGIPEEPPLVGAMALDLVKEDHCKEPPAWPS